MLGLSKILTNCEKVHVKNNFFSACIKKGTGHGLWHGTWTKAQVAKGQWLPSGKSAGLGALMVGCPGVWEDVLLAGLPFYGAGSEGRKIRGVLFPAILLGAWMGLGTAQGTLLGATLMSQ